MKLDDLITLHNAGYTKEDIFRILGSENAAPAAPEDPAPLPDPEPAPAAQPAPEPTLDDDRIKQLETKLDYVINRFNYLAVQQSSQPDVHEESIDDILASVVRGFEKEK